MLDKVSDYYSEKIKSNGISPRGVDWNSKESQYIRYDQLTKLIELENHFSILDYGCGYCDYYYYLTTKFDSLQYIGYDISKEMLSAAKEHLGTSNRDEIILSDKEPEKVVDFVVASGLFNVKLDNSLENWRQYIEATILKFDKLSKRGFSFNILTSYSDKEYLKDYLFYANPSYFFSFCKENISKNVALLHDYQLYEFTIIVRK